MRWSSSAPHSCALTACKRLSLWSMWYRYELFVNISHWWFIWWFTVSYDDDADADDDDDDDVINEMSLSDERLMTMAGSSLAEESKANSDGRRSRRGCGVSSGYAAPSVQCRSCRTRSARRSTRHPLPLARPLFWHDLKMYMAIHGCFIGQSRLSVGPSIEICAKWWVIWQQVVRNVRNVFLLQR